MMMTFLRKAAVGSRLEFPRRLKISHRLLKAAGRPYAANDPKTDIIAPKANSQTIGFGSTLQKLLWRFVI